MKTALLAFVLILISAAGFARGQQPSLATRQMYFRLTGLPLLARHPEAVRWNEMVARGEQTTVAKEMSQEPGFINHVTRSWAERYLLADTSTQLSLNDAVALVVGVVRDDLDIRSILTGDFSYGGDSRLGNDRPQLRDNAVFNRIQERGLSLKSTLRRYAPQWLSLIEERAGLLSTRWFGETNYQAGTNRRAVKASLEVFLCQPIEAWKTANLSTSWIRRDVHRAPNNDPRIFQTECRSCHAPMDAFAGAFAHFDYVNSALMYSHYVAPKYRNLSGVYPDGHVTEDNRWKNLLLHRPELGFGSSTMSSGSGIKDFGLMLAKTDGFLACLAKRSIKHLCAKDVSLRSDWTQELQRRMSGEFQYRLRDLLIAVAIDQRCGEGS